MQKPVRQRSSRQGEATERISPHKGFLQWLAIAVLGSKTACPLGGMDVDSVTAR